MFLEISLVVVGSIIFVVYYISTQNKREKIDFHGKHVVITGGSSGIGFELSVEAFKQGAHVSIIARNKGKLSQIRNELESIKKINPNFSSQIVQTESLDISSGYSETEQTFERLVAKAGPVDILINNAGVFGCSEFSETDCREFENMMKINYLGGVYCTKAVINSMKKRRFGRIHFVSSQAGQIGIFGYTAYSPTKFALKGFAEALQMELKPYNVYVGLSYPPDTDTPGLAQENMNKPEETRIIAGSSGVSSAKSVSNGIVASIKKGSFHCYYGVNGILLSVLTSGASPITTFKEAIIQIFALPLCRLIAVVLVFTFDLTVKSCYKKKTAGKN